jgi:hypothetical protein
MRFVKAALIMSFVASASFANAAASSNDNVAVTSPAACDKNPSNLKLSDVADASASADQGMATTQKGVPAKKTDSPEGGTAVQGG